LQEYEQTQPLKGNTQPGQALTTNQWPTKEVAIWDVWSQGNSKLKLEMHWGKLTWIYMVIVEVGQRGMTYGLCPHKTSFIFYFL
jgi:hypothetical protein